MRSVVKLRVTSGTGGRWFESNLLSTMRGVAQLVRAPVYSLLMGVPRSYWENGWWRSLRVTSSAKGEVAGSIPVGCFGVRSSVVER